MSLVDLANKAKDVKEPQSQPDGQYKLSIMKIEDGESGEASKNPGKPYTRVYYKVENPVNTPAQLINDIFMHVDDETPEDQAEMRALQFKRFMAAFKLTTKELSKENYDKLKGRTAWAQVKETDDPEYGLQNKVKKWIAAE